MAVDDDIDFRSSLKVENAGHHYYPPQLGEGG